MSPIPYARIEAVFLDAGNTLISIDFPWVAAELAARGVACEAATLRRAEAAARPIVSRAALERGRTEGEDAFTFYLRAVLGKLDSARALGDGDARRLAAELVPVLRGRGTQRLWSHVLPGVPEALADLRALGLRLIVVSNSDGTVEQGLADVGLRPLLDGVVDSHVVGFEKPDPRIFHAALGAAGCPPERALHVGDLYAADVVGARAAGIHPLLLDPYGDWGDVDCERSADLTELAQRMRRTRS